MTKDGSVRRTRDNPAWYSWCRLGSHDYHVDHWAGPGLCRVQVGDRQPCACPCHNGDEGSRGWHGGHDHYDSLHSYIPGVSIFIAEAELAHGVLAEPELWTWEILEDQVTLKDMQFRHFLNYPRTLLRLARSRQPDSSAAAACAAIWDLLRRITLRESSLESFVAEWSSMRDWKLTAGLPWLAYSDNVGVEWMQLIRFRTRAGSSRHGPSS